jgi:hypothetical protein
MSLLDLWKKTPDQIQAKHVQQLIAFAGEGHLADGNDASAEFRQFLSNVSSELLLRYTDECLQTKFDGSGFALQDVVNEIGARLGFEVTPGRYRGTSGSIGFDGLWLGPEGNHIIVEVKTTDAYRIDLDTIADYRRNLIKSGQVKEEESSILIIVGRQDTGDLEAQIRGSRHAWDVRLISVDSLIRLLTIREEVEDPSIEARIRAILVPREFTRVDGIIDLAFSATEEILHEEKTPAVSEQEEEDLGGRKFIPVSFHEACVARIIKVLNQPLLKRSRAIFTNADNSVVVLCAVSREHNLPTGTAYWFAFHPHQKIKLESAANSYVAFGCGSPEKLIMIPFPTFAPWVEGMNQTHREDGRSYWHVQIFDEDGRLILHRKKDEEWPDVTEYLLKD